MLAVAAQEHVRLIHAESEEVVGRLPFPEGVPHVIRFSRDGAVLMVAGGRPVESGRVVLFDVRSGNRLAEIGDEVDAVLAADLSPDQRSVALGGSGRVVKVYSTADGRKITANDDNPLHLQDPVVSTRIDFDGHAFVVVERSVKQPHRTSYAVHIGTNRRPMIAFPLGGTTGTRQVFRMIGDASGAFEETLPVPTKRGDFEFFGDAPSSLMLRSSPFPNVLEEAYAAEPRVQRLPAALNGVIDRHDDVDAFRFPAKKDEALHIRVFAASMGSPIDARISIRPINSNGQPGEVETKADDSRLTDRDVFGTSYRGGGGRPGFLDPSSLWKPKADGEYVLEISDSSGSGGTTGVYRIEIERPRTVVQTVLRSRTFDWSESTRFTGLALPRGGRWTVNVSFPNGQWNRPKSPFALVAHGLPEGVRLISPRVPQGVTIWPMQLIAKPDAKVGGAAITLEARPVDSTIQVESRSQENSRSSTIPAATRCITYRLTVTSWE